MSRAIISGYSEQIPVPVTALARKMAQRLVFDVNEEQNWPLDVTCGFAEYCITHKHAIIAPDFFRAGCLIDFP